MALRCPVHQAREERVGVLGNLLQMLAPCNITAHVVRRPTSFERFDIAWQIFSCRPHERHRRDVRRTSAFRPRTSPILAFTSFFTSETGSGSPSGNRIVPFETS